MRSVFGGRFAAGRIGRCVRRVAFVSAGALLLLIAIASAAVHFYLASKPVVASGGPMLDWNEHDGVVTPKRSSLHMVSPMTMDVETDSRGARVAARGEETPSSVDVLAVGCSWTYGWGVEDHETMSRIISRDLGVRVANLGIPAAGTTTALRMLERNGDLRPRVVLYTFMQDHLNRNLTPCAAITAPKCISVPYVRWDDGVPSIVPPIGDRDDFRQNQRFLERYARNRLVDAPWIAVGALQALMRRIDSSNDYSSVIHAHGMATLTFLLARMAEESRRIGATLVVLYFPQIDLDRVRPAPQALLDALPQDVRLVDLTPDLRSYLSGAPLDTLVLPDDGHPNPTAYRLFARAVEPVIADALAESRDGARP